MLMGESTDQSKNLGDVIIWEQLSGSYSRESCILSSGSVLLGEVIGKFTSTGKYKSLDPAADNGTEVAAGVSLTINDETDGKIMVMKRQSILKINGLVWPDGITAGEQAIAEEQLESLGILVR